ncbi:MAG: GCN5-related N-acetyltransferase [Gemmatimonadetes bacterium]|nr:GCN5-related N-acetyltransferase [Gemmatimonadota bacterium]
MWSPPTVEPIDDPAGAALTQPTLHSPRLLLRPFAMGDAPRVHALAGTVQVADTTLTIPHPYPDGAAEEWIALHAESYARGIGAHFAIVEKGGDGQPAGAVGLVVSREHRRAELGYWVGVPFWGRGWCTEAAREVVRFAFGRMELARVVACHFARNPASGVVMRKIGMRHEGTFRSHVRKWGRLEDVEYYGILCGELTESEPPPERPAG